MAISPDSTLDIPATSAEVTLTELKQAGRLPNDAGLDPEVADPGNPLTHARWTGKDGETKTIDEVTSGNCAGLGMAEETLLNEPDPRPGEFVRPGPRSSWSRTDNLGTWNSTTARTSACSRSKPTHLHET
ncbi:hypothetical protein ACIQZN_00350 [Streptomyces sp. NPDC097595]|uniref:hypothetical protein n=1 Tax=Streptomyces sp. NPDC097595 TaxID=3366090 RepID=UPI0038062520